MSKEYSVYKHTVPNGKIYVGISANPRMRWNNGEGYRDNEEFYSDIKKYGWDSIEHEIVEDGLTRDDALHIESVLIAQFKSCEADKGYNRTRQTREAKSKRIQLLIKPSVHKSLNKIATMKQASLNSLANDIFEEYVLENGSLIQKYDEIFGED